MIVYHQPTSLEDAVGLMRADPSLVVLAGGTDVYPAKTTRGATGIMRHGDILDLTRVPGLRGIEDRGDHWWIGALTTWSEIVAADLPPLFDGLKAAAREIGGVQIQNRGTIGGNLCTASPAGDSIPVLMALEAEIECAGAAAFRVPAEQFFTGYRRTVVGGTGTLVTGVRVQKQAGRGFFKKLGARRYLVISIAMVAAVFAWRESRPGDGVRGGASRALPDQGSGPGPIVERARIAVGACAATARRLTALEQALVGQPADPAIVREEHLAVLEPIDDVRASAAYRRAAARQLVADVLAAAREAR